jgi:hypothetical protein
MSQAGKFVISSLPPGTIVETLTGNSGGAVGPDGSNNINVVGDGTTIDVTGSPGTNTLTISALSSGGATSFPTDSGTATPAAGILNIIADNAALNAGSSVSFSGSGNTVLLNVTDTNNNTIIGSLSGNNTITGANNTIVGQFCGSVLTIGRSNVIVGEGSGNSMTDASSNILIGISTGPALVDGTGNIAIGTNTASSLFEASNNIFIGNNTGVTLFEGISNIMIGGSAAASLLEGNNNIIIGENAGASLFLENNNMMIGVNAGTSLTSGTRNVLIGGSAGASLINVSDNTFLGFNAGNSIGNGQHNIIIGSNAGTNYGANESNNILIGSIGIAAESNILRIGQSTGGGAGQLSQAFISGIDGVNVGSVATVVTESGNQLGTAVITGGSGITVTPGANSIVISGSGSITFTYTNVNTSPYVVLITDEYLSVDCSGGPITIQLSNAATLGKTFVIKDRTGSAAINNITVTTVGGAVNIDGATTFVMNSAYQAISLLGNNTSYEVY